MSKLEQFKESLESQIEALTPAPGTTGELSYEVEASELKAVALRLRDEFGFEMLMDLCGVDYLAFGQDEWKASEATDLGFSRGVQRSREGVPGFEASNSEKRFAVAYQLLSIQHNLRLRLKAFCEPGEPPLIDSMLPVWSSADWFEREAFDLFGILFRGHPDLRRLLTDYGFIGHPFRKDFPLIGNVEVRYDPEKGRVVYQPVSIEPRTLVPKVIREDSRYLDGDEEEAHG